MPGATSADTQVGSHMGVNCGTEAAVPRTEVVGSTVDADVAEAPTTSVAGLDKEDAEITEGAELGELEVRWLATGCAACHVPATPRLCIAEVMEAVQERAGVPVPEQRLFVDGVELPGDAAAPSPGTSALTLVRSVSDPRITNLGHFRPSVAFEELPRGAFTLVARLAAGINGDVFRYRWRQGGSEETVAVKCLRNRFLERVWGTETDERTVHLEPWRRKPDAEDSLTEIGILQYLSRQPDLPASLLRLRGVFAEEGFTWLVTEFADGGDLFDMAASGCCAESKLRRYGQQLLQAVAYLHRHSIGHRDVSLENVLLRDGQVKLMDFGMAVKSHSASGAALRYFRAVGKDNCRAPELYVPATAKVRVAAPASAAPGGVALAKAGGYLCEVRFGADVAPGQACMAEVWGYAAQPADVFSCGVCLFMLAWQCPPWQRAQLADPMFAYVHGRRDDGLQGMLRHWRKPLLSPDAMQLLTEMLRANPAERPSAAACLASPWLAEAKDAPISVQGQPQTAESAVAAACVPASAGAQ